MQFLKMLFTWWHGATLGTALFTSRRGRLIGTDDQGNKYYVDKKNQSLNGKVRRLKLGWRLFIFYKRETLNKNTPIAQHGYGKADKQNGKA